jgi:hypothetical protein
LSDLTSSESLRLLRESEETQSKPILRPCLVLLVT